MTEPKTRLDPRTVPRSRLLERLGPQRPGVSVVALIDGPISKEIESLSAAPGRGADRSQIILAGCAGAEPIVGATAGLGQADTESLTEFANRAAELAIGRLLLLLPPGAGGYDALPALLDRFAAEAWLGAIDIGGPGDRPSGLITRQSLWSALGGLETSYLGWGWAVRDFCLRARAIGYAAADRPPAGAHDGPDARVFEERLALAPDRSDVSLPAAPRRPGSFAVYTAITDCYDSLKPQPASALDGCVQVAFLDRATAAAQAGRSRGWRIVAGDLPHGDPHRAARFPKINAHLALPKAEYSLWIDASIGIACPFPLQRLAELFLGSSDLCLFRHHARGSIYEEAEVCKAAGLDRPEIIDAQIARYRSEGLPRTTGLVEAPVVLRRHTATIRRLNEGWWTEVVHGSRRDQLSFNYVAWKLGLRYAVFPLSLAVRNGLFVKFLR